MTFTLNILIDLCLIFACYRLCRIPKGYVRVGDLHTNITKTHSFVRMELQMFASQQKKHIEKKVKGEVDRALIEAKVAEKLAEKAFNMAGATNLGVLALQRTLQVPRLFTKDQAKNNLIAKKKIDDLFGSQDGLLDLLRPVMTDEEIEIADKALLEKEKADLNGN